MTISRPSRIDPPRNSPKFPPRCPKMQVTSQARYSLVCTMMKSENAICNDTPEPCIVHQSNFISYLVEEHGGGQISLVLDRRSEFVIFSLSNPMRGSML